MIRDIFESFNIDTYAFIEGDACEKNHPRLFASLPSGVRAVFFLMPYYVSDVDDKISAYGAVYDYHAFAKDVFSSLEGYFDENYPNEYRRGFCDHSPYIEVLGAAKAGLGVIGENSLLITKKYSSYVFIGTFVTTLSAAALLAEGINEGAGVAEHCTGCGLCKAACPSGCLERGSRDGCASAVTQKKGALTEDEVLLLKKSKSIWGCDRCQAVCPYTKRAIEKGTIYTKIDYFKSSFMGKDPSLFVKGLDDEEFSRYPFSWRKREVIERNIEIIKSGESENG